jgi:hypothetical protein
LVQTIISPAPTPIASDAPSRAQKSRDLLIDVTRGLAITLVALGHTNQGILHRSWWGASPAGVRLNDAIYAFHMPAFFFVSGVFLRRGVAKRGEKGYTFEKLRTIIYPYVLWAFIYAGAPILFARFTIVRTPTWKPFLFGLITGNTSWFLPSLFFALMIGMLFRRLPMALLFLLSIAAFFLLPRTLIGFEDGAIRHLAFLVAGMWVGSSFSQLKRIPSPVAAIAAILFGIFIVWITGRPLGGSNYLFIPLGFLGTLMLLLIARCLGKSATARGLAWTGVASFGIFLMSSFPQGAGREVLSRLLRITSPGPQLIFPTLLAVIVPAWLYHHRKPLHIQWMFIWPF